MSYRTVTVDGVDYKYVVGKKFVKVRGLGLATKRAIGRIEAREECCECCGEPMSSIYEGDWTYTVLLVGPKEIADGIRDGAFKPENASLG